ncbi:MAG TPA: aminoglycoside adenylyltransferase domain-containing protein [Gaiellaceae bacterium]|nr:aminoglycoside adenylyltransferase domain-containing protein [Gaiellaceae bacterium]
MVVTLCRALYTLATGEQATKEAATAWAAATFPEWASFVDESLERYRADVHEAHHALIEFTDRAVAEAERLSARG